MHSMDVKNNNVASSWAYKRSCMNPNDLRWGLARTLAIEHRDARMWEGE
jgi:hypothetical protein